jgi:hypothetical protein
VRNADFGCARPGHSTSRYVWQSRTAAGIEPASRALSSASLSGYPAGSRAHKQQSLIRPRDIQSLPPFRITTIGCREGGPPRPGLRRQPTVSGSVPPTRPPQNPANSRELPPPSRALGDQSLQRWIKWRRGWWAGANLSRGRDPCSAGKIQGNFCLIRSFWLNQGQDLQALPGA